MFKAREKNAGWRIDYFIVSKSIENKIKESYIYSDIMGSDHCPVGLDIEIWIKRRVPFVQFCSGRRLVDGK